MSTKIKMPKKLKKALKIVGNVLFWCFFALAISMTILTFTAKSSATGSPQFGDTVLLSVKSDSMSGTFEVNDVIICKVVDQEKENTFKKDDIVTFVISKDGEKVLDTHRIVRVNEEENVYYTKGDNEESEDSGYRRAADILAVYTGNKLKVIGPVISFLQTKGGFIGCIIAPLGVFFAYEVVQLVLIIDKNKNKKLSAEQEEAIKQKAIEEFIAKQQKESEDSKEETK